MPVIHAAGRSLKETLLHFALLGCVVFSAVQIAIAKDNPVCVDGADSNELLVYLEEAVSAEQLAEDYGLQLIGVPASSVNAQILAAASVAEARRILPKIRADERIRAAFNNRYLFVTPEQDDALLGG